MKVAIQGTVGRRIGALCALFVGAAMLASCGGGGNAGNSPFVPTTTSMATNLVLALDKTTATNSGSDGVTVTVTATDQNNNVVASAPVSIAADSNAVVIASDSATDATGKVTAEVQVGNQNRTNRTITITATSGSVVRTATFQVIGASLKSTVVGSQSTPGATGQVNYVLSDINANPMSGQVVTVTAFGSTTTGTTDASGTFVFPFTAPTTNGVYPIVADAAGAAEVTDDITVAAVGAVPVVPAGTILAASVEANPSVVSVNTTSTANQSAIRAIFLGANNAPVPNVRVRFDLAGDVNSIGGTFTTGSTIVYSTATGEATSAYVPATRFSPTDGVTIRACYGYTDADVAGTNCAYSTTTTLTVVSQAISVSIGTDRKLIDNTETYIQDFVVTVVDSSGNAKADVQITPSIDLLRFAKGYWTFGTDRWFRTAVQDFSNPAGTPWYLEDPRSAAEQVADPSGAPLISTDAACWNEDRNRNGVLEDAEDSRLSGYSISAGGNGNGKLDPAKADVAISINGSSRTDASGKVIVRIEYAKNLGSWVEFKIQVAASGVGGTEGRASWTDTLGVMASDVKNEAEPPFIFSRYGKVAGCDNPQ